MKKIILLSILSSFLVSASLLGQGTPGIQFQGGLNLSQFEFDPDFIDPTFIQNIPNQANLGYSFGISGELPLTLKQSLTIGIATTQITAYPRIDYGLWYGMVVYSEDDQIYLNPSYLQRMRFDLIEIPISWRFYILTERKIRPYFGVGVQTSFVWRERERWTSLFDEVETNRTDFVKNEYESRLKDFRHFRSSLTLNFGGAFVLNENWDLMIDVQNHVLEQRRQQRSSVTNFIPEYWGDDYQWLGQTSLNIGLRRKL